MIIELLILCKIQRIKIKLGKTYDLLELVVYLMLF